MLKFPGVIRGCAPPRGGRGRRSDGHDLREVGAAGRAGGSGGAARGRPRAGGERGARGLRPRPRALRQGRAAGAAGTLHAEAHCRAEGPRSLATGECPELIIRGTQRKAILAYANMFGLLHLLISC